MFHGLPHRARGFACVCAVTASILGFVSTGAAAGPPSDQLPANFTLGTTPHTLRGNSIAAGGGVLGRRSNGNVLGVDSLQNWSSYFYDPGQDGSGFPQFTWPYTMVGRSPFDKSDDDHGGQTTTTINAPVVPVNIDLRNADGSPRFVNGKRLFYDATQFVDPSLKSPVFSKRSSSRSRTRTGTPCSARRSSRRGP